LKYLTRGLYDFLAFGGTPEIAETLAEYNEKIGKHPYSVDRNLWGYGSRFGELDDPWKEPPEEVYSLTAAVAHAPDEPLYLDIGFKQGIPVEIDGEPIDSVALVEKLNRLGGEHAVGRFDMVENRLHDIKSREVYEAPAAQILHQAHRAVEDLTLPKDLIHFKNEISRKYTELIYNGDWFTVLRKSLDAFFLETQIDVTGVARIKIFKGNCMAVGRKAGKTLYQAGNHPAQDERKRRKGVSGKAS